MIDKQVSASIAINTIIDTAGAITVSATSTENFHELALDVGVSTSNAAVDGSVIVVVINATDDAVASAQVSGTVHAGGSFDILASDDLTTSSSRVAPPSAPPRRASPCPWSSSTGTAVSTPASRTARTSRRTVARA